MKKKLLMPIAALMLLAGCDYNEENFNGLEDITQPTNVFKKEYAMIAADYAAISSNKANVAIAKAAGLDKELKNVGTNKYFTSIIPAETYMPAFLADKYYTADDGAAVKVTYDQKVSLPEYVNQLNKASIYTLAAADYQAAWGATSSLNFFTPSKPAASYVAGVLAAKVKEPVSGQLVCASYNVSSVEPAAMTVAFKEDFETSTANAELNLANWTNTTIEGTAKWQGKSYSGNKYAQQSAFNHAAGELDSYLISKEILVEKGMLLTFDAIYVNYVATGGAITVLVSTDLADATTEAGINAAKWDNLTAKFTIPTSSSNTGDPVNVGSADLAAYVGKKIRIAFRYQGNGTAAATTTIRMDNVAISTPGKNVYEIVNTLYSYNGTAWAPYTTANVLTLSQADFSPMGSKYDNFSASLNPDNYLPTFLKQKYPYAQEGDVKVPVYKFFATTTSIRADEYIYTKGQFVKNDAIETVTDQFVRASGVWKFDPSVVITLPAVRGNVEAALFYQTITDWVKVNKGTQYVTTFGNNDYYYGGSAYNNNFDFRPSAWKSQAAGEYGNIADADLTKLMFERLPEAFLPALEKLHADAKQVAGVEVTYTINFFIFDGSATTPYVIKYLVTGNGKFEFIKGSLLKL